MNPKISGNPSDADGGGARLGSPPLDAGAPPQANCGIHPVEVAPEAGFEPPSTQTKPGGGSAKLSQSQPISPLGAVTSPLVLVFVLGRKSCSAEWKCENILKFLRK